MGRSYRRPDRRSARNDVHRHQVLSIEPCEVIGVNSEFIWCPSQRGDPGVAPSFSCSLEDGGLIANSRSRCRGHPHVFISWAHLGTIFLNRSYRRVPTRGGRAVPSSLARVRTASHSQTVDRQCRWCRSVRTHSFVALRLFQPPSSAPNNRTDSIRGCYQWIYRTTCWLRCGHRSQCGTGAVATRRPR